MTPTKPRFRTPSKWRSRSSAAALKRSRQRQPGAMAQLLHTENALHSFAGSRKLPGGIVFNARIFASLRSSVAGASDAAVHVRNELKRRAELFFLLHAVRTPPSSVHLYGVVSQTTGERIVLVLAAVAKIVGQPERSHDQHCVDRYASPIPARGLNPKFFFLPFSSLLRHGFFISRLLDRSSNHHPERRGKHFDRPALQCQHFAIHHHVHWPVKLKVDPANRLPLRQRMPSVRAIIKRSQVPNQSQSPNRSPPHVLNQSVIGDRVGRDHHRAARELAIVKRQKQAAPRIKLTPPLQSHRKRPPIKPRQTKKNGKQIPKLPQSLKPPVPQRRHIGRKSHAQQIRVVDRSVFGRQAHNITKPRTPRLQRLHRVLQPP